MTTLAEYMAILEAAAPGAGYTVVTQEGYSSSVAKDHIISVSPPAGTLVIPNQVITVLLSRGPFPASRWSGQAPELAQAAVESVTDAVIFTLLAFFDFPGDPTYVCDAGINPVWDGHEWIGMGQFGSIDGPNEALDLVADPVRFTLSGCDADLAFNAQNSAYAGRSCVVHLALMDPFTLEIINEPTRIWKGFMDVITVEAEKNQAILRLDCERRLRRLPTPRRMTDEDQRARFPTDRFFQYLHLIKDHTAGAGGRSISYADPGRSRDRPNRSRD